MIQPSELVQYIKENLDEGAHVEAFDKTGMADHYILYVRSGKFAGMNTLKRHRTVQQLLKPLIESQRLHAAELKLEAPEASEA